MAPVAASLWQMSPWLMQGSSIQPTLAPGRVEPRVQWTSEGEYLNWNVWSASVKVCGLVWAISGGARAKMQTATNDFIGTVDPS